MPLGKCYLNLILPALALAALGCSNSPSSTDTVSGSGEKVNATAQPITAGDLLSIDGTYGAGCTTHTSSDRWSLALTLGASLANDPLKVVKNNGLCVLTIADIVAGSNGSGGGTIYTYDLSPTLDLLNVYQSSGSAAARTAQPNAFFANAKMNPADFSSDFKVTVLYSDTLNGASGSKAATYDTWSAGAVGSSTTSPNYTWVDNLAVKLQAKVADAGAEADAGGTIVSSVSGSVDFTDGTVLGDFYVVNASLGSTPSFAEADTAFNGGTQVTMTVNASVPASAFTLAGLSLPQVRTVIIRHLDSGVAAYQTLQVTFSAP
jgi:hypothetical protein